MVGCGYGVRIERAKLTHFLRSRKGRPYGWGGTAMDMSPPRLVILSNAKDIKIKDRVQTDRVFEMFRLRCAPLNMTGKGVYRMTGALIGDS